MEYCGPHHFVECYVNAWLWMTVPWSFLIIGSLGNLLNLIILSRQRMRKYSTTVYLLCLAVADMLSLWMNLLSPAIDKINNVNFRATNVAYCKFAAWIGGGSSMFSIWLLVLMTTERVLLTVSPIWARSKLNRRNAIIVCLVFITLLYGINSTYLFANDIRTITFNVTRGNVTFMESYTGCLPSSQAFGRFFRTVWRTNSLITMSLIPMMIIIAGNLTILRTMLVQKRRLRRVNSLSMISERPGENVAAYDKRKSSTRTLFLICAMFLLTNVPYSIHSFVVDNTVPSTDPHDVAIATLIKSLLILVLFSNYTFNFFLYFVSGTMFKQEFRRLINQVRMKIVKMLTPTEYAARGTTITVDTTDTPLELH